MISKDLNDLKNKLRDAAANCIEAFNKRYSKYRVEIIQTKVSPEKPHQWYTEGITEYNRYTNSTKHNSLPKASALKISIASTDPSTNHISDSTLEKLHKVFANMMKSYALEHGFKINAEDQIIFEL